MGVFKALFNASPMGQIMKSAKGDEAKPAAAPAAAVSAPSVQDEEDKKANAENQRRGRLALIATSSQGVLGTAPVGRRKLLSNN